jgi:hypothetical protein
MYIYLILDPFSRLVKIGTTKNVNKRLLSIKTANPFAELFFYTTEYTESFLHEKFKDKRIIGEWFELDKYDLYSITKSYSVIPKRMHYFNTKSDIKRRQRIEKSKELFDSKFIYKLNDFPSYVFSNIHGNPYEAKAFNLKTKKELKTVLKCTTLGFVLNSKFHSLTKLLKTLKEQN